MGCLYQIAVECQGMAKTNKQTEKKKKNDHKPWMIDCQLVS